jgi:hypothetical protein
MNAAQLNGMRQMAKTILKVGDKVRVIKRTRHNMIPVGTIGEVVEIRHNGTMSDGVSVRFMRLPDPYIAKCFGKDPTVAEPMRVLFSHGSKQIEPANVG